MISDIAISTLMKGESVYLKDEYENEYENRYNINVSFENFWNLYDKKRGDKSKLEKKWKKLSDSDRLEIMDYIPKYKSSQPEKKYRKDPSTFINNKSWKDELLNNMNSKPRQLAG